MSETVSCCSVCGAETFEVIDKAGALCRCRCGFIFHNPRPAHEEVTAFYERSDQYEGWLAHESEREELWLRRWIKMARYVGNGALLDVGTGTGQFLHAIRRKVMSVYGTEISGRARDIAKTRYGLDILEAEGVQADFGSLRFSTITLFHVLEHVPDPGVLIHDCYELLQPGGILVIAVPNDNGCLLAKLRFMLDKFRPVDKRRFCTAGFERILLDDVQREVHLSHFSLPVLRRLLGDRGFTVLAESLDPYFVAGGFLLMCHRIYYMFSLIFWRILRMNIYPTIWIVAKRD
jgi:SAM-dependent methyltransferase